MDFSKSPRPRIWTRDSSILLGVFLGIFAFMSLTIVARADLKTDALIVFVGMFGGLAVESWGTQTNLWRYYAAERPPLWIDCCTVKNLTLKGSE